MKIKGIIDEDFVNYKLPSMYIIFPVCDFKCDRENECQLCQNSSLIDLPDIEIDKEEIIERYLANPITKAFVLGGLEPFDSEFDLLPFIDSVRRQYKCDDPIVIYTGYTENELDSGNWGKKGAKGVQMGYWNCIKEYKNIIVKFGRYRPNQIKHFDEVLGVELASLNQYAKEYNSEDTNQS